VQRFQSLLPDEARSYGVALDNSFDYYYDQLIPGSVEWMAASVCQSHATALSGAGPREEQARQTDDFELQQGLLVGNAIVSAVAMCMLAHADTAADRENLDQSAVAVIQHTCPQFV
jgi:hypothetical protein